MLRHTRRTDRRGAILIVVLAMLSLFAIVGITFVLVASASAEKQRILRDAAGIDNGPAIIDNGEDAFSRFLAPAHLRRVPDRCHGSPELAPRPQPRGDDVRPVLRSGRLRAIPCSGARTWRGTASATFNQLATPTRPNDGSCMNYRQFSPVPPINDPEITGERARRALPGSGPGSVYVPKNAPYTYPDINNLFLASICPATGEVLVPSFHRQAAFGSLDPSNPNWTSPQGKYLTPAAAAAGTPATGGKPGFPPVPMNADGTYTGDVQNLTGALLPTTPTTGRFIARNDSIWIDIGAPIVTGRDGRRYKMLVAPLILDLDGRINLSVAGNRMKPTVAPAIPTSRTTSSTPRASVLAHGKSVSRSCSFRAPPSRTMAEPWSFQRGKAQSPCRPDAAEMYASRYAAGQHLPSCSKVAWTGFNTSTAGSSLTIPELREHNPFWTSPSYSPGCYDGTNMLVVEPPRALQPGRVAGSAGNDPAHAAADVTRSPTPSS